MTAAATDTDWDEHAARDLHLQLRQHGIASPVWWDRCPCGVRIPLTENLTGEDAPSLYVQVEARRQLHPGGPPHLEWFGTLRVTDHLDDEPLGWTTLTWLQPAHRTHVIADQVRVLLSLLRVPTRQSTPCESSPQ